MDTRAQSGRMPKLGRHEGASPGRHDAVWRENEGRSQSASESNVFSAQRIAYSGPWDR